MKKSEVRVGGRYLAKVSGSLSPVRLDRENPHGGWDGTNLDTGRQVRIKSAQRLRGEFNQHKEDQTMAKKQSTKTEAKAEKKAKATEPKARKKPERKDGTMSGLDAAAKVLADAGEALNCKTIVERALEKGLWKTGGKTPAATVYSAILREIAKKGSDARFQKADRGLFALKA